MKTLFLSLAVLGLATLASAQTPVPAAPATSSLPKTPPAVVEVKVPVAEWIVQLETTQKANEALLEKQKKTMELLEQLKTTVQEIKTFGKRS